MVSPQSFDAVLEAGDRALGWTTARVPFDPATVWSRRVRHRVRGTMNGFAFRGSLFPVGGQPGSFYLLVNRAVQQGSGAQPGTVAHVTLEPDLDPRPAELPDELDALLDEAEGLRAFYDGFTEYARREMGKWIAGVKGNDARLRRARQMAERLLATMEAERELPPLIARAFRASPQARDGWSRLTPLQRRSELMAVFSYASPEAREKRLSRLCALAESKAV